MYFTVIVTVLSAIILSLYVTKCQDYRALEKENKWLWAQRGRGLEPVTVDDVDLRPLDKESAMEAVRFNGFVPEAQGHWITFMSQGEHFLIDAERFPVLDLIKHYNLDHGKWDMDLMHDAAHQVTEEFIMAKVLFTGEQEDGISFQITAIENKYGHFKDCLTRYISIIEDARARMREIYDEMYTQRKDQLSMFPRLGTEASSEKKIMS